MAKEPRTSSTHPLRIDTVDCPGGGQLGLSFCPGKKQDDAATGSWDRDLATDIAAVKKWGAVAVVSLLETAEYHQLKVPDLGQAVTKKGINWIPMPLPNDTVPDAKFLKLWATEISPRLRNILSKDKNVFIHCMGGIGRTSVIAAMLLVDCGMKAADAVAVIKEVRPGSFYMPEQEEFILNKYKPVSNIVRLPTLEERKKMKPGGRKP